MSNAIEIQNLSKSFGVGKTVIPALNGLNLLVKEGTVTALVGPDGAGKTTLMRLIMGLMLPDSGEITVFGHNVLKEAAMVQDMAGYMPQRFGLYEDLTVMENMKLYGELKGLSKQGRANRYRMLFRMSGLEPFTDRMSGKLSGGMKQKLGLICTLLSSPRLLILDEPTVGVDPLSRRELWNIIGNAVKDEGVTVLVSTAYLDEAERCDQVILLDKGNVVAQGDPAEFLKPLRGRTFFVTAQDRSRRELAVELHGLPHVLDTVLQSNGVRVIFENGVPEVPGGMRWEPVPPRFEDAFVTLLAKEQPVVGSPTPNRHILVRDSKTDINEEEVIVVRDLEKWFGDFCAVNKVSFTVKRGEIFGLLGANGAGKSTTFRMLCGLLPATRGVLQVAGENLLHASSKARAKIGYMAQRFSLYATLTVLQNLRFFAGAYGLTGKKRDERIQWALAEFELEPFQNLTSLALSLGYKQRLALAAALMHEPEILFLDEPTSGVDPLARREFWREINRLAQTGVTVLVTTHFMEEAEYCDRLVIMSRGEVLVQGEPEMLKTQHGMASIEDMFVSLLEQREDRS
ncbi:MAG: ATP-binding cassette domain-containing protein [Dissulfuribacterales bacterium]